MTSFFAGHRNRLCILLDKVLLLDPPLELAEQGFKGAKCVEAVGVFADGFLEDFFETGDLERLETGD